MSVEKDFSHAAALINAHAVASHMMGEPFVPKNQDEVDDELMTYAEFFCASTGVSMDVLGDRVQDIRAQRFLAQLNLEMEAHDRWWADVQRRRAKYGYGLSGRIREWWGERR